jgi:hypothetical protein
METGIKDWTITSITGIRTWTATGTITGRKAGAYQCFRRTMETGLPGN